jgi:DNA helicase-2/ATP-dependent DNA helicase PcrA
VVLYRTNAQSRALEESFRRRDLPYQIIGGTRFYERREIMDVLAYLRLISNPKDAGAFDRVVNYPRRGIGDTSRTRLLEWGTRRGWRPLEAAGHASECDELRGAAAASLESFAQLVAGYAALAHHIGVGELLERLVAEIGLAEALRQEGPEGEDRWQNVGELIAGAHEFDATLEAGGAADDEELDPDASPLDVFLQKVSLLADVDRHDPGAQAVVLMTLHNAKGLEFVNVFISGLEDGLFPLARAFDEPETLEEERRLFYVGITRACRKLYLTHARSRRRAGEIVACIPSSFLRAIPELLLDRERTAAMGRMQAQESRWKTSFAGSGARPAGSASFGRAFEDDGGRYLDLSESQDEVRFIKGERVLHPQFGRGVIRELSGFGRDLKAVIDFEQLGRRKVMLRFANLQKEL